MNHEVEFDIGDRVIAVPDTRERGGCFYSGTVTGVFETFGNRGRRFMVRLDSQARNQYGEPKYPFALSARQQRLGYVFGAWQLVYAASWNLS